MNKKVVIAIGVVVILLSGGAYFWFTRANTAASNVKTTPTKAPPAPVNQIPVSDRPYVVLEPTTTRNELQITIGPLVREAKNVEVSLEYDRNKGVMDAVLKQFTLSSFPYIDKLFLGSKSAGGHITYHEEVIGGKLTLTFNGGKERYALEVPWRYDDTKPNYSELSTSDAKFQVVFAKPFNTPKVVVMQSPGLPGKIEGTVIAGPYLFRGVGKLPPGNISLTIRLPEESTSAQLYGWDGAKWQSIQSAAEGKMLTATTSIFDAYVVVQ